MPEYLAPGVFVEEVSFRSDAIEGVSTSVTAFVGPTRFGPTTVPNEPVTSLAQFEKIYGDGQALEFAGQAPICNYLWHAARAFFEEGGRDLYVARVFSAAGDKAESVAQAWLPLNDDVSSNSSREHSGLHVRARFPGLFGRMRVRFTLELNTDVLSAPNRDGQSPADLTQAASRLTHGDVVLIGDASRSSRTPGDASGEFYLTERDDGGEFVFTNPLKQDSPERRTLSEIGSRPGTAIRVVTTSVATLARDSDDPVATWQHLPLHPGHESNGVADSLFDHFAQNDPGSASPERVPLVIELVNPALADAGAPGHMRLGHGIDVLRLLFQSRSTLEEALLQPASTDTARSLEITLEGGNDGIRPGAADYEGQAGSENQGATGLKALENIEDIATFAAPGATFGYEGQYRSEARQILQHLIAHAERKRYRVALLDSGDSQTIAQLRAMRTGYDSTRAALYYPWVRIKDPVTKQDLFLPPSGFVAGLYARNDMERGVNHAPANMPVRLATGLQTDITDTQQSALNPEGINCIRNIKGRGYRVWGARTLGSDPELKYVNVRRYLCYLERSIELGTQWAVFEPNEEPLWARIRHAIADFLYREWRNGGLLGSKADEGFFVRCDRSTMTQNDLDNGRLVCLVGVALTKPAEFVVFRIGQWTADHRS